MTKDIMQVELTAMPAKLDECFDILAEAGADEFALFGGAVRDTDYAAYHGTEMDVSIRPRKVKEVLIAGVAIDRAGDVDIGLSSVAIASDGIAWGTPEYLDDRNNRTLSVYPHSDAERLADYTRRMARKYPDHTVIIL